MKRLSILILTLDGRKHLLQRLLALLTPQLTAECELLVLGDNGQRTIGAKRQDLLQQATGSHVCFIDDDDLVKPTYVKEILQALATDPDCVCFAFEEFYDGRFLRLMQRSLRHNRYGTLFGIPRAKWLPRHKQPPNHFTPIRRSLALQTGFDVRLNRHEDMDYSARIYPLLKSEVYIPHPLYIYDFRPAHARPEVINHDAPHHFPHLTQMMQRPAARLLSALAKPWHALRHRHAP